MRISLGAVLVGLSLLMPAAGHCGITLLTDYDGNGTQPASNIFRQPSFSGSTATGLAASPDVAAVSTDNAFSGAKSLNVQFAFKGLDTGAPDPNRWLRLTTSGSNPVIDAAGAITMKVFVASQDPLMMSLGIREKPYATDFPLGSTSSGASGAIKWVGATGVLGGGPIGGHIITPGSWQDLTFLIPTEPVYRFTGTGGSYDPVSPTFGKVDLESLAIRIPNGSISPVNMYIDDIQIRSMDCIPEPGTLGLLATGLLPLLGLRRRRTR